MIGRFYLAGSLDARAELRALAAEIEDASGWQCTSRWLARDVTELTDREIAQTDVEDVRAAGAMILVTSQRSTRGGMWVELGLAIERRMHVAVLGPLANANVFCFLPGIDRIIVYRFGRAAAPAAAWLLNLERRRCAR